MSANVVHNDIYKQHARTLKIYNLLNNYVSIWILFCVWGIRNPLTNYRCRDIPQNKCCPDPSGAFCRKQTVLTKTHTHIVKNILHDTQIVIINIFCMAFLVLCVIDLWREERASRRAGAEDDHCLRSRGTSWLWSLLLVLNCSNSTLQSNNFLYTYSYQTQYFSFIFVWKFSLCRKLVCTGDSQELKLGQTRWHEHKNSQTRY